MNCTQGKDTFSRVVMIPQIIGVTHSKSCVGEEKKLRNDIN